MYHICPSYTNTLNIPSSYDNGQYHNLPIKWLGHFTGPVWYTTVLSTYQLYSTVYMQYVKPHV